MESRWLEIEWADDQDFTQGGKKERIMSVCYRERGSLQLFSQRISAYYLRHRTRSSSAEQFCKLDLNFKTKRRQMRSIPRNCFTSFSLLSSAGLYLRIYHCGNGAVIIRGMGEILKGDSGSRSLVYY